MSVRVLFFASLRERLGYAEKLLESAGPMSVSEVWLKSSGEAELPANVLISINQAYADAGVQVVPGDEVAFFPPVTGG